MEVLGKLCVVTFLTLFFLVNYKTVASLQIRGIGDPCTENQTCADAVKDTFCSENENVCKCESDIPSDDKTRCLVRIGGPCDEDEQCARGDGLSVCLPGSDICECEDKYTHSADLTKCLEIINDLNGHICEEDSQCRLGKPGNLSSCRTVPDGTNKCRCNDNAVDGPSEPSNPIPNNNKCYLVAEKILDPCVIQTQCTVKLMHSQCRNDVCVCADEYVASPDSSECLPRMALGQSCRFSEQCQHIEHSTCSFKNTNDPTGICTCSAEYTTPPNQNDLCLKKAIEIGGSCAGHLVQCQTVSNSECIEQKCVCPADHVNNTAGTGCLPVVQNLNGPCSEDRQCQVQNSMCQTTGNNIKTCTCKTNFVESKTNSGSCVEIVYERNKPCKEEVQCIGGLGSLSTCTDGVCQCKLNYGYHNGKCYIPAKLNELCEVVEQCYVAVNNLTVCSTTPEQPSEKRCRCLHGTIPFQNNQKCFDPTKRVGSSCDSNDECTVSILGNVYCDTSTKSCACQLGSLPAASNSICTSDASNIHQYFSFIVTLLIVIVLETTL